MHFHAAIKKGSQTQCCTLLVKYNISNTLSLKVRDSNNLGWTTVEQLRNFAFFISYVVLKSTILNF